MISAASEMARAGPVIDPAVYLAELKSVVAAFESGDDAASEARLGQLLRSHEEGLFVNLAKLTRELHQAMKDFSLDSRLQSLAGQEIPDACLRLDYVAKLGEDAANRTLDLVDAGRVQIAVIDACNTRLKTVGNEPVNHIAAELAAASESLRSHFSGITQAQEYQDLSGQVIRRVMTLVQNVEAALIKLLQATSGGSRPLPSAASCAPGELAGPQVPGLANTAAVSQQDAEALLLELGF